MEATSFSDNGDFELRFRRLSLVRSHLHDDLVLADGSILGYGDFQPNTAFIVRMHLGLFGFDFYPCGRFHFQFDALLEAFAAFQNHPNLLHLAQIEAYGLGTRC